MKSTLMDRGSYWPRSSFPPPTHGHLLIVTVLALFVITIMFVLSRANTDAQTAPKAKIGSVVAETNEDNTYYLLPLTATNIIKHGNGWYEFTLNDQKWLFRGSGFDHDEELLALIPKTQEQKIKEMLE